MEPEQRGKKIHGRWIFTCVVLALVLAAGSVYYFVLRQPTTATLFSKVTQNSVQFPIYYPSSLPTGYKLDKSSIRTENQIVFYSISSGNKKISVSEQAAPANPPDFDAIQKGNTSFKKVDVIGGRAICGVYQKIPAAIFISNTTLVNIYGISRIPLDVISQLAQNIQSLPE